MELHTHLVYSYIHNMMTLYYQVISLILIFSICDINDSPSRLNFTLENFLAFKKMCITAILGVNFGTI